MPARRPRRFAWRRPPYEFEHRRLPIDILCGIDTIKNPVRDRGKIFNDALLKAVGHKEAPAEVKAAMKTEDGDELEIVEEPLPEQFDPERKGEQE